MEQWLSITPTEIKFSILFILLLWWQLKRFERMERLMTLQIINNLIEDEDKKERFLRDNDLLK